MQTLLNGVLIDKTLAAQARAHGTSPPMPVSNDSEGDAARALAAAELARIEKECSQLGFSLEKLPEDIRSELPLQRVWALVASSE